MITREEVDNLAAMARLAVSEEEKNSLHQDLENILGYVSGLPADVDGQPKTKPERYNVLRPDVDPREPGLYTETLLEAMAERKGQYMKVKKIIDRDL